MEIILKQDIPNLGFKDDLVTVKDGYATNYLIPKGMAIMAVASEKKKLAETIRQRQFKEEKIRKEAEKLAEKLQDIEVKIGAKVGHFRQDLWLGECPADCRCHQGPVRHGH